MQSLPLIVILLLGSLWAWTGALRRLAAGDPLLAWQPRQPRPWGLVDFLIGAAAWAVCLFGLAWALGADLATPLELLSPAARGRRLLAASLATLCALLALAVWMSARYGASLGQFGIDGTRIRADLRLGLGAFLLLAPVVYAIQLVLVQWFRSRHPLTELLEDDPDLVFFALSGFTAVLVAPVAEEAAFRLWLQAWFERVFETRAPAADLVLGGSRFAPEAATGRPSPLPVLLAALLFALAHASHGPDPIPLFVLAIGVGVLYQRTQRILPCIIVHGLLNATSLCLLLLQVYLGHPD